MDATNSLWGAVALAIATIGSVLVAKISRPQKDDVAHADLNTIAGLAQQMVRLNSRVTELEAEQTVQDATISALQRYTQILKKALRGSGATVPEPDPLDAPYLRAVE